MIVLYIILGIIGLLLLIAFVNTIIIKDRQPVKAPLSIDPKESDALAKDFAQMIRIETLSYDKKLNNTEAFDALHRLMEKMFPHVFETMEKHFFEGGALLFKWKGKSSERPMVLMAHQDVVPAAKEDWEFDPFSGKVTDTEIYGRGTLDTKSTLYGFFRACEELIKSGFVPEQDTYLSSSTDEENSGPGSAFSVEYLKKNGIVPYIVLDEGGAIVTNSLPTVSRSMAMVGVFEKGYVNFKFKAKSKGGHSSTPPKNTPIARLAMFINACEKYFPMKTKMIKEVADIFKTAAPQMKGGYRFLFGNMWLFKPLITALLPKINSFGRALLSTTIAFTMQKGSDAENVIPSEAYVIANCRTLPIQDIQATYEVLSKIAAKYDIETEILDGREASPISNSNNAAYTYLKDTIIQSYPDVIVSPYVMLGGTDCRFFSEITESAYRISPVRMSNEEIGKIHGKNESIKKTALVEAKNFYKEFIKNHK